MNFRATKKIFWKAKKFCKIKEIDERNKLEIFKNIFVDLENIFE
jgi:hypothetical protein